MGLKPSLIQSTGHFRNAFIFPVLLPVRPLRPWLHPGGPPPGRGGRVRVPAAHPRDGGQGGHEVPSLWQIKDFPSLSLLTKNVF